MSLKELHHKTFRAFLKGKNWDEILTHVEAFLDRYLEKMLNPTTIAHLKEAQKKGHYTLILSSSPSFLVKSIAERLKVNEWRATEYQVDHNRKLSKILFLILGSEKARHTIAAARRLRIDPKKIVVFTDSICDLPLAKIAGRVIAVNPDRRLKSHYRRKGWQII